MSTAKRLSDVFNKSKEIEFDELSKIIIMSDVHRGDGSFSDDFLKNRSIFFRALSYYYNEGYTYIELGDGDELWENKSLKTITQENDDVFKKMSEFYKNNRLYMLYGNHDISKKYSHRIKNELDDYFDEIMKERHILFKDIEVYEGLILKNKNTNNSIFLVHGHQGEVLNDKFWKLGRFLVYYLWRHLQLFGINDPTDAAKNYKKKNERERLITKWVIENNQMVIAGHTHRPAFPNIGEALYFNDGSGIHPGGITGIEICKGEISLVKWSINSEEKGLLYVEKDILKGPVKLKKYFS